MDTDETAGKYRLLREHANDMLVRQEVLSRPDNSSKPLKDQEFFELRIQDLIGSWRPGFEVTQWHICWSESDQQFLWEDEQREQWTTLQAAQNRFETRLRSLRERGFTHSDMDF